MKAEKIASQAGKAKSPDEFLKLAAECHPRRMEIRARIESISHRRAPIPLPPERAAAVERGPDAVKELDDEIEALDREHDYLNMLELQLNERHEQALNEQARDRVPRALRAIPQASAHVREALADLDTAIETLNELVAVAGEYERAGLKFPYGDRESAELAALRAAAWTTRTVRILTPPGLFEQRKDYPQTFALTFIPVRGQGGEDSMDFTPVRAPAQVNLLDVGSASYPAWGRE